MKNKFSQFSAAFLFVIVGILVSPKGSLAAGPVVTSDCSTGRFILTMTPPVNHAYWELSVHDKNVPFDPTVQNVQNFKYKKYMENTYGRNVPRGHGYHWFVQSVSITKAKSEVTEGMSYCALKEPMYLESGYDFPNLTLSWRPVEGAVRYAVSVDNMSNGWNPSSPLPGDILRENLTAPFLTFSVARDQKLVWRVFAIDKEGVWSDSSVLKTVYHTR